MEIHKLSGAKVKNAKPLSKDYRLSDETIQVLKLLQSITSESKYLVPGQGRKTDPEQRNNPNGFAEMGYKDLMTGHGFMDHPHLSERRLHSPVATSPFPSPNRL